jgi:hypothetical protein
MGNRIMLADRIEQRIREWPDWSRGERRIMDAIVEEIMEHVRDGTGNTFIRNWCDRYLSDLSAPLPS